MGFLDEWPPRIARAFADADIQNVRELSRLSATQLLLCYNIGPQSVDHIRASLARAGLTLRGEQQAPRRETHTLPSASGVYFVQCGSFVKIGRARNVKMRLQSAATFVPQPLLLRRFEPCPPEAAIPLEAAFHERFRRYHHHREWFRYEGALEAFLLDRSPT